MSLAFLYLEDLQAADHREILVIVRFIIIMIDRSLSLIFNPYLSRQLLQRVNKGRFVESQLSSLGERGNGIDLASFRNLFIE